MDWIFKEKPRFWTYYKSIYNFMFFEETKKSIFASTNAVLAMIFGQIVKRWKCWWVDITLAMLIVHIFLPGSRCGIKCFASLAAFRAVDNAIIVDYFRHNVGLPGVSVPSPSLLVEGDQCCMICHDLFLFYIYTAGLGLQALIYERDGSIKEKSNFLQH